MVTHEVCRELACSSLCHPAGQATYQPSSNLATAGFGCICYVQFWLAPELVLNLYELFEHISKLHGRSLTDSKYYISRLSSFT
jgi:hypothetical protein